MPVWTRPYIWIVAFVAIGAALMPGTAEGQVIPIKTAPIATGSQFQLYPARARGMGNLSIAVDDSLGDAFVNPAKGSRLPGTWAFSAPTYYTITGRDGHAQTLSVGALVNRGDWFGGMAVALQQLDTRGDGSQPVYTVDPARASSVASWSNSIRPLRESAAENRYLSLMGGAQLTERWTVAGSVEWAGLNAMDGVDLLYPGNQGLEQDGHRLDVRVGLLADWTYQSLSVVLVHSRTDMQHDVARVLYQPIAWDQSVAPSVRSERYHDRTNTWGLHAEYVGPLGGQGWRLGAVLTGNRKGHPKIPNYDLMNIPRDPGTSWAYNFGIGVARTEGGTTVGADIVLEPIFSETWAETEGEVLRADGRMLEAGERSVVNDFTFANTTLRTGFRHREDTWEIRLGFEGETTRYWLTQEDRIEQTTRDQYEGWTEWRLTWGGGFELGALILDYSGHLTLGTGQPGVVMGAVAQRAAFAGGNFVLAPRGTLGLERSKVFTHQISLILPLQNE